MIFALIPLITSLVGAGVSIWGGIEQNNALRQAAETGLVAQGKEGRLAQLSGEADIITAKAQLRADVERAEAAAETRHRNARIVTIAGLVLVALGTIGIIFKGLNLKK